MSKTVRAVADGFYDGLLQKAGATFEVHDGFDGNWVVEVEDHDTTVGNVTEQETLNLVARANFPSIERVDIPLPEFHPGLLVPDAGKLSIDEAEAQNADGSPIEASRTLTSTSDPEKSAAPKRKRGADAAAAAIEVSESDKAKAKEASHDEVEGQKAADDGEDLV